MYYKQKESSHATSDHDNTRICIFSLFSNYRNLAYEWGSCMSWEELWVIAFTRETQPVALFKRPWDISLVSAPSEHNVWFYFGRLSNLCPMTVFPNHDVNKRTPLPLFSFCIINVWQDRLIKGEECYFSTFQTSSGTLSVTILSINNGL